MRYALGAFRNIGPPSGLVLEPGEQCGRYRPPSLTDRKEWPFRRKHRTTLQPASGSSAPICRQSPVTDRGRGWSIPGTHAVLMPGARVGDTATLPCLPHWSAQLSCSDAQGAVLIDGAVHAPCGDRLTQHHRRRPLLPDVFRFTNASPTSSPHQLGAVSSRRCTLGAVMVFPVPARALRHQVLRPSGPARPLRYAGADG